MKISQRVQQIPYSAIRKLTPLADEAKKKGKKVYHLNIGAPDTKTPQEFFDAIGALNLHTLDYAPSKGLKLLREKTSEYYKKHGIDFDPEDEIVITNGASEALLFAILAIADLGQNILTSNPFYSNYLTVFRQCGIDIRTFNTSVDNGYRLPSYEDIITKVDEKTCAILISNPSNPTGAVYTEEEIRTLVRVAVEKDLFIIGDEVYREFVFNDQKFFSFAEVEGIEDRLILLDSISKRFGACGARIGSIASKNKEFMYEIVKLATARLAVATVEQMGAAKLYEVNNEYFTEVHEEYKKRKEAIVEELKKIEGVKVYNPDGAFYVMPTLPVDDTDDFAAWLLEEFDDNGETVMVAPAYGFYHGSNVGKKQIRLAYVINEKDLRRAVQILAKAIKLYNNR